MTNKRRPGKGYKVLSVITEELSRQIRALDDEKLHQLVELPKTLTQTNCGWVKYRLSGPAAEIAENELKFRGRI